jgi:pyruvate dehydrogenase E2 component (dihydrolipoamide acetyltransferase)
MAKEVIMPKVDMDQETGTVIEWHKKNGDYVKVGDVLLVIETDKVAVDVQSPGSGILQGISVGPGEVVPIGTVIAYLLAEGESLPAAPKPDSVPEPAAIKDETTPHHQAATPIAKNMAAVHGLDISTIVPSGKGNKVTKADVAARIDIDGSTEKDGKINASPAARRTARENQIDLALISGSGPKGRVQSNDVFGFIEQQKKDEKQIDLRIDSGQAIPLIGIRRTIAERMLSNYQNIPHIRFTSRVNMSEFEAARIRLNEHAKRIEAPKVSATTLFVKLVASTLPRHPFINSSLKGEEILLHGEINIGVAVALENGLIVPVIKNADSKGIAEIASEVNDLSTRARNGTLVSSEVKGGTFTITNLGPFGVEQFDAIINAPEAAILAIGATQLEAIPGDEGKVHACPVMHMTLSADHRIVDGSVAAHFIADLKTMLEDPILLTYF